MTPRLRPRAELEQLSRNELLAYVNDLQNHVESVCRQCDDLRRENELYSRASGSFTFGLSGLLEEQHLNAQSELQQLREKHSKLEAQYTELQEDAAQIKNAKRVSDTACRQVCLPRDHCNAMTDILRESWDLSVHWHSAALCHARQRHHHESAHALVPGDQATPHVRN
jgi:hypothetical protein